MDFVRTSATKGAPVLTMRLGLLLLLLTLMVGAVGRLDGKGRAPETELVFLYLSENRGEIEECG